MSINRGSKDGVVPMKNRLEGSLFDGIKRSNLKRKIADSGPDIKRESASHAIKLNFLAGLTSGSSQHVKPSSSDPRPFRLPFVVREPSQRGRLPSDATPININRMVNTTSVHLSKALNSYSERKHQREQKEREEVETKTQEELELQKQKKLAERVSKEWKSFEDIVNPKLPLFAPPKASKPAKSIFSNNTVCPICETRLDSKYNERLKGIKDLRDASAVCREHRRAEVLEYGHKQGYPVDIQFAKLPSCIQKHRSLLNDIVCGERQSYFLQNFHKSFSPTSKASSMMESLLKDFEQHTPGYYGPRGARIMIQEILKHHRLALDKMAREDATIGKVGVVAFVQGVLVPELGMNLIMDDLDVNEDDARRIMLESSKFGQQLHDDEEQDYNNDSQAFIGIE